MFKATKRVLTIAAVISAAITPSVAYARPNLDPPAPSGTNPGARIVSLPSAQRATVSSQQAFQWGDAGIGAAGVLVLVGVGSGGVIARRRGALSVRRLTGQPM